jgi:hypothetical protein
MRLAIEVFELAPVSIILLIESFDRVREHGVFLAQRAEGADLCDELNQLLCVHLRAGGRMTFSVAVG